MLRTNLSTRPFYNERLVQVVLAAIAIVAVALTVFNGLRLSALSGERSGLMTRIREAETRTAGLRRETAQAERNVDRTQLARVVAAAREANALIDQRTFSWTELLNRLETTLPDAVRVQAIKPGVDKEGRMRVQLSVVAHQAEDIEAFIEQLEASGGFEHMVSTSESTEQGGELEAVLDGRYRPGALASKKAK